MRDVRFNLFILLLLFILASCQNDKEANGCNCDSKATVFKVENKMAKISYSKDLGMYILEEYKEGEVTFDPYHIYMVDGKEDMEKIRSLNTTNVVFSGNAMKTTPTQTTVVAGAEYYCLSLTSIQKQ